MISIIAPALDEGANIRTFLDSLVHQTYKEFELIIVEGGSSDNTLKFIMDYAQKIRLRIVFDGRRNFGIIRNFGALHAQCPIMLHCNTDNYLEPFFLERLMKFYEDSNVISVGGRIYPFSTKILAHIGYQIFDTLRWFFSSLPPKIRKYRPSGNFMSIRSEVFWDVGGHPEVRCNEDGLLGERIDSYAYMHNKKVLFRLDLYMGHWVKKFESMGGLNAIMFYFYTMANFFTFLKPLLKSILSNAELVFEGKTTRQLGVKDLVKGFWNWL